VIRFQGVSKAFGPLAVLKDITFEVERGETVGLLGASGSGKTTILQLIVGAHAADTGSVSVETSSIGYVFQEPRLLPWRTARQNIALPLRARGVRRSESETCASAWLGRTGLQGFEDYYPAQLSGGMLQRVSIGRALAISPDVLLMDEPFSSLDMELRESLLSMVAEIISQGELATVYVTHYLPEALRIADRVLELDGRGGLRELNAVDRTAAIEAFVEAISPRLNGDRDARHSAAGFGEGAAS
jgi:NitT/TauT family transport system ATP-binding protein